MEPVEVAATVVAPAPTTAELSGDMVKLVSSDGQEFTMPLEHANMSVTIKNLVEDAGIENPIPLPNVEGKILALIIEYCKYHVENPTVVTEEKKEGEKPEEKRTDNMEPWDKAFLDKLAQADLFALILASNYLDIKDLLDVSCQQVANMIKARTPEEIRAVFNIKNEFTPEEEEQVRKENEWCEER